MSESTSNPGANVAKRLDFLKRWEKYTTIPLATLAFVYLIFYTLEVFENRPIEDYGSFEFAGDIIWVIFIFDFLLRFALAPDKWPFLRRNVVELVAVILPMFRSLGMFRVLIALGFLIRVGQSLRSRVNIYLGLILPLLIYTSSLGIWEIERRAEGANILTFEDSIWWAFVTVSTIGYGDFSPITFEGRTIAVILMITRIGIVSVITANLATWFLQRIEYDIAKEKNKA